MAVLEYFFEKYTDDKNMQRVKFQICLKICCNNIGGALKIQSINFCSLSILFSFCGCSLAVTSTEPDGFMVFVVLYLGAPEDRSP